MSPEDYQQLCFDRKKTIFPLDRKKLESLPLKRETIDFLAIGLPKSAAPYVSFATGDEKLGASIDTLDRIYNPVPTGYNKYVVIGADGSGSPVAVNTANGDTVEWLDHEDGFTSSYFNNSIGAMLQCFLIYEDFLETILIENGDDAVVNSRFTDAQFMDMKNKIISVDPEAISQNGFWKEELEMELANREYYASQG